MEKSNLVLLNPVESVESKAFQGVKSGLRKVVEAQAIMRKQMGSTDCDRVVMGLFMGAMDVVLYSLDLQPSEIDKLLSKQG